jgi:hypothetical protein
MGFLRRLRGWLGLFHEQPAQHEGRERSVQLEAPVLFHDVSVVGKSPPNEQVAAGRLYCILSANKPKWSLFQCPCGCRSVITLSLQSAHNPHWSLTRSNSGRPTLYPSVWRDKGCLSHFWLKDGRVFWCIDTGSHPDLRRHR